MAQSVTLKTGLAIASMVLGIAGLASSILLIGLLLAPVGLVLGIVALVKASKKPMVYGGQGFAIAGVVTGGLAMLFVPVIAAIAIPNLLASKRAADEGSAISGLKTLYAAEQTYLSTAGVASCGDLNALAKSGLIDSALASGTKYSYRYEVTTAAGRGCEVFATPVSASSGHRSFMIAFDGVVRGAKKNGVKADRFDPELDNRAKAREFKY
jgi:hypothetical protein